MTYKKIITIFILILIIGSNTLYLDTNAEITEEPCKILFIGSSYFTWDNLPGLFGNLTDAAKKDVYIDQSIKNGLYLYDHVNRSITESKINQTNWDYVILQGVCTVTAYPENYTDHPLLPSLIALRDKIAKNCNSTKMVFYLPWAFEDGMTWLGWDDTYEDMQLKIYDNTLQYSKDVGFAIAPVGCAWNTVLKEVNYSLHYLHQADWNHPSLKGSYLMACTIFSTIFRETSTGISYYSDLSRSEANYFQEVASNTVLDNLELWNLDPLPLNDDDNDDPSISGFSFNSLFVFILIGLTFFLSIKDQNYRNLMI